MPPRTAILSEVINRVRSMFKKKDEELNIDDAKVDEAAKELLEK